MIGARQFTVGLFFWIIVECIWVATGRDCSCSSLGEYFRTLNLFGESR